MLKRYLIAISFLMFLIPSPSAADTSDCVSIETDKGKVTGVFDEKAGVCSYKGIPYAAPPVGDLRFRSPREHDPWDTPVEAFAFSPDCPQKPMSLTPSKTLIGDEDCLYMNIWHAAGAEPGLKPVMYFLHGGGFTSGAGSWDIYDGTRMARYGDVVVVNVNYRLGPLGFLVHPALEDNGFKGNYGIQDQIFGLKWIRKNIAAFGGDPDNITIFGESAGGMSVAALVVSPETKGLYRRAIIESGPVQYFSKSADYLQEIGLKAAAEVGCGDPATAAECLRSIDAIELVNDLPASLSLIADYEKSLNYFYEIAIDGKLIPDSPIRMIRRGEFPTDVPLIIGSNTDEASFFTSGKKLETADDFLQETEADRERLKKIFNMDLDREKLAKHYDFEEFGGVKPAYNALMRDMGFTCPARQIASEYSAKQPDVFLYVFAKAPDEKGILADWGAFHGSELAFVYGNFQFMGIRFSSKTNNVVSKKMMAYWTAFAHTGKPAVKGLPEWKPFNDANLNYMWLDRDIVLKSGYRKDACDYLDSILENL